MDKPLRPQTLPGQTRPGGGLDRPTQRPGAERPGISRPGVDQPIAGRPGANRPINVGDINIGNNQLINKMPNWANIDRSKITNINNRLQNNFGSFQNWESLNGDRLDRWHDWGNGVTDGYWDRYHGCGFGDCFNHGWWASHAHGWCGWHYGYWFNNYGWDYWWTAPTFGALAGWFSWSAPQATWSQPAYYDYSQGGNVVYEDNNVYVNNQPVATSEEYAQSAMTLATVEPPATEEDAKSSEWMPLGTFAVSVDEKDNTPARIVQLAVNKQGVISGTLFNAQTDDAQSVQGQVDKETQRVAFRIGESGQVVVETGLYNLTKDEVPILVHFGTQRVENWLLVRLDAPENINQD